MLKVQVVVLVAVMAVLYVLVALFILSVSNYLVFVLPDPVQGTIGYTYPMKVFYSDIGRWGLAIFAWGMYTIAVGTSISQLQQYIKSRKEITMGVASHGNTAH